MIYVEVDGDNVRLADGEVSANAHIQSRWDWNTFEEADAIAQKLTETTGVRYIATDGGSSFFPRYDVIQAPTVGDEVSYSFNGDTYPCGKIKSISKSMKLIVTDGGKKFYRRRQTGAWVNGGTWFLVPGHHREQNPHF